MHCFRPTLPSLFHLFYAHFRVPRVVFVYMCIFVADVETMVTC